MLSNSNTIHSFRLAHSASVFAALENSDSIPLPSIPDLCFQGQIVRIRSRYSKLAFIDIRFAADSVTCKCCAKITVVINADNLPSLTCTSYKKGKVKLGDIIQVSGDLVFADASGWVDTTEDTGDRILEARILARAECVVVERFVGRGFEQEMPVHEEMGKMKGGGGRSQEAGQLCKFWINSGGKCPLGDKCTFIHVPVEEIVEVRKLWLAERRAKRLDNATLDWGDPTPMNEKLPHACRAAVFADWIIETFGGNEKLSSGTGVFDIAGGGGQLSLDLTDRGVSKCTVVDSRPLRVGFALKKWVKKNRKKTAQEVEANDQDEGDAENDEEVDEHEDEGLDSRQQKEADVVEPVDASIVDELPFKYLQHFFVPESVTPEIAQASLLVGMHPDQATGAIVEAAIQCNLPFAVIPCCVFKDDFRDRILKNGKPVATTLDLVEWIKEKRPEGEIQTQFLNFQGKNLVVYRK